MISHFSDKTLYILYRIFGTHLNDTILDKSSYYRNKNGQEFLGYYLIIMNKFFNLPIESISSQIPFSQIWCEKVLSKFNVKRYNTILDKVIKYDNEYENAKQKLFRV